VRALTDADRLRRFMRRLGGAAHGPSRVYFTGGATAVLLGWRSSTIDVDLQFVPERDELLRAIATLKEELTINVELAAPSHFIPELPGWETRSLFIVTEGLISYYHYDFYAQALAKIERGHAQDRSDVDVMLAERRVTPVKLRELFDAITPNLYRYPALDENSFRAALERVLRERD
jgi:uncharacterized nucleotidyltransferase DUF6036